MRRRLRLEVQKTDSVALDIMESSKSPLKRSKPSIAKEGKLFRELVFCSLVLKSCVERQ